MFTIDDKLYEVKFNKARNQTALIAEDDCSEISDSYCGNENCLKNYEELQQLRDDISRIADEMEEIFFMLKF